MNFTSFHFVAFFGITLLLGHFLKNRTQRLFLLLASYYFYGVFEPWYLVLILSSTIWDYVAAIGIEHARTGPETKGPSNTDHSSALPFPFLAAISPKAWLFSSLIFNLGLLGYFKYTNFGIEIYNDVQPLGDTYFAWPFENILLPVGISFYTFQSLSYTIDVYRGLIGARRSFIDFAMYVAFFPQLVAGPIVRATTFFEQLDQRLAVRRQDMVIGMTRIVTGLFRKLVLSDNLAIVVNTVFGNPQNYGVLDTWIAGFAFGFQIYLDFAGYTDIARGVARLFGFEFDVNFRYPMAATNITDHWKRWHISLTTWIRDYVYIPLGGSRVGPVRLYSNILIIWVLTGIWHGPAYHFVFWGIWQAAMLLSHRFYTKTALPSLLSRGGLVYTGASWVLTMFSLNFGFIFFRAPDMAVATQMIGRLFSIENLHSFWQSGFQVLPAITNLPDSVYSSYAILLGLYALYDFYFDRFKEGELESDRYKIRLTVITTLMIFAILTLGSPDTPSFMYFQF